MALRSDAKIIARLLRPTRGKNHRDRLEHFYGEQADGYDAFREKLLTNRAELIADLPLRPGERLLDIGGGTGRNLEFFGNALQELEQATVLDLCEPLLAQARRRIDAHGWRNVDCVAADATVWRGAQPYDVVTCSYSLSMIPDWYAAIDNCLANLRPGGRLAVVDFHLSRKHPRDGWAKHGYLRRHFWRWWFAHDNVFLREDLLPYLADRCPEHELVETLARVPYMPGKVPVLRFIGRKPATALSTMEEGHSSKLAVPASQS